MKKTEKRTLLIVDDDSNLCAVIKDFYQSTHILVESVATGRECLAIAREKPVDVVLLDQRLPDIEGYQLCPEILRWNEQAKIIFITAYSSFDNAVKAIQAGASDYLPKPIDIDQLDLAVQRAIRTQKLEKIEAYQSYRTRKESESSLLIGSHGGFDEIHRLIDLASRSDAPVLITGETGTGKNAVARAIHYQGPSAESPYLNINCSSLPENLFEAELFGYERGAFTDAQKAHKGIFIMAEGGTLLLDEIGSVPMHLQAKLLSVLDDRRIKRIGGETFIPVDVRIIAATNSNLEDAISRREFREDLYYRLNVIRIHIPPLRERKQDIPALCRHFLDMFDIGDELTIGNDEYERLVQYHWPGNIRELKNIVERAVILRQDNRLNLSRFLQINSRQDPIATTPATTVSLTIAQMERRMILSALEQCRNNYTQTAKVLDISLSTLKRKVREYRENGV